MNSRKSAIENTAPTTRSIAIARVASAAPRNVVDAIANSSVDEATNPTVTNASGRINSATMIATAMRTPWRSNAGRWRAVVTAVSASAPRKIMRDRRSAVSMASA